MAHLTRGGPSWLRVFGLALVTHACSCEDDTGPAGPPLDAGGDADAGDVPEAPDALPRWDFGVVPDGAGRFGTPELHSITPDTGPSDGGTTVVLRGQGFLHAQRLALGGVESPHWYVREPDEIVATTPAVPPGTVDVELTSEDGSAVLAAAFSYFALVRIDGIEPASAPTEGGTPFVLTGAGLSRDVRVLIGAHSAIGLSVESDERATGWFPPNAAGAVDLWAFAGDGSDRDVARRAVTYRVVPRATAVVPAFGPLAGGTPAEVTGEGLAPDVVAVLGGTRLQAVVAADGRRLRFVTPPASAPGPVDLVLHSPVGDGCLAAAYTYLAPDAPALALHSVRPTRGPAAGDQTVEVVASGLSPATEVSFGGRVAACRDASPGVLACQTPAHEPGPVSVALKEEERAVVAEGAYTYLPEITLESVAPEAGPSRGGSIATLRGNGFEPGADVRFGPLPARWARWLSEETLTVEVPPGTAGPVDVTVRLPEGRGEATLRDGYTYRDEFSLLAVDPDHGSRAGGTWVALIGTGFTPGLVPDVGDRPAMDVALAGATRYTFRTPPGDEGPADVGFLGIATLPGAFTYFNPASRYGGTWGHAIHGQVNVTLLDSYEAEPVEGAFAMLGTDPATPWQGLTNAEGQVTLSGPGLVGPVTLTAGKDGFEPQTFATFDAENVTMYMTPLIPPTPGGSRPRDPPPTGTINGTVSGIDKYVPEPEDPVEVRIAFVETTRESVFSANPLPGPGGQVFADGELFEITSRPGDVAVVVVAGILNQDTGEFTAYRMGVERWLYVPIDGVVEGVHVHLSVPLVRRLGVTLYDAPMHVPDGPDRVESTPWFEFSPEGWFGGYNRYEGWARDFWIESMPLFQSHDFDEVLLHILTSFSREGGRPMSQRWTEDLPWDTRFVEVGPFVGIPRLTDPPPLGTLQGHRMAWDILGGVPPDVWSLRLMTEQYSPIWRIVMPGAPPVLRLPDVATLPPIPPGRHLLTFGGGLKEGFTMDSFEYSDLSVRGWDAWSSEWEELMVGGP